MSCRSDGRAEGAGTRSAIGWQVWLIAVIAADLWLASTAWAQDRQKQVLVIYATRRDAQIVAVGEREMPKILEEGLGRSFDYYSEYLDQGRFPDPDYLPGFRDFLKLKYQDQHFDAIVAMEDVALAFLSKNRRELFPDSPIVFFSSSARTAPIANSTGVVAGVNLVGTLHLVEALQPEVRQVFVVIGAAPDNQVFERAARQQFAQFGSRFAITYLSGLPTRELEARLASLPPRSVVYYLIVDQDGAGEHFHPLDYAERLALVANAPVYCWVDSAMGRRIVGGNLKSQTAEVDAVARLTLRVLQGEPTDHIPVVTADLNVTQVDWRELNRWGIPESRVPAGTAILFREPTIFERYRSYVELAVALFLAQTALIAGLLVQRARRRRAEAQARQSEAELRASNDRLHDLGGRLLSAQDEERSRIARELHDDINQQVALLAIDLELLRNTPNQKLASDALHRTELLARSVHDLSHRLHPAKLRLIGLVPALKGLEHELSRDGVGIDFTHDGVPPTLPPDITVCLFRVVQEALQNAIKYSGARHVSVHLSGSSERLTLTVTDRGAGFDVETAWGKGIGLVSMTERLDAVGGTLNIQSAPGAGTRLEMTVPLPAAAGLSRADSA